MYEFLIGDLTLAMLFFHVVDAFDENDSSTGSNTYREGGSDQQGIQRSLGGLKQGTRVHRLPSIRYMVHAWSCFQLQPAFGASL